jgi:phosphohistidine swiveling domain-containing protein
MLKKEEYLKTVRRPYPPLFCTLVCRGYQNKEYFKDILDEPYSLSNMVHADNVWYYGRAEIERGGQLALASWQNPAKLKYIKEEFERRANNLVHAASTSFEDFCAAYQEFMPSLTLIYAIDKPTESSLREALSLKVGAEEVEKIMNELNIPLEDNYHKLEEYELVTSLDIKAHVEKYKWLYSRYDEQKEYTENEALEKLSRINKDEFLAKWKEEKEHLNNVIKHAKYILQEKAYLVDIFQYMIYYRTHRTDTMNRAQFLVIPILKQKAESLGLNYEQILRCSAEELLDYKIPPISLLEERIKDCTTILDEVAIRCLTGKESEEIIAYFNEEIGNSKEVKGTVASRGHVKGKVRIILDKKDFHKMEDGDILIASMTTPEMVPIMQKAAAFVTDEGGVTCHAAIISRELKKPCVIGTKIATKVFKDGDMVEVDANLGVVKMLNK